ncbi:hypothetical protein Tco_0255896 [Tanacetum coccineum]
MASFDYRLNTLYAIKECSSCGALYTRNCGCSKGSLEDKILVPVPDSSQRPLIFEKICLNCGDPVHGLYCRQCALIRKTLEEVFQDFQDTSESSDDDTNFVNENQEPFVVNQDPGKNSSQSPPQINHNCCYECGDSLDGIFCQRCTCKSCGKGAHIGYNCPPKAPIISNPEPCNQTIDELPQTLPSFDLTCYSEKENSLPYVSKPNFVDDSPNVFNPPPQPPMYSCEFCGNDARYGHYCTPQVPFIYPEPCYNQDFNFPQDFHDFQQQLSKQMTSICDMVVIFAKEGKKKSNLRKIKLAKDRYWKIPICYDDDDDEESSIPFKDIIISGLPSCVAITPTLLTKEPIDSLIMEDEHLDTIPVTESDEVIKSSVEDLVPIQSESEGIFDGVCDVPLCDNPTPLEVFKDHYEIVVDSNDDSSSSDLNVHLLIANIETNTFDNSLTESETFCFNLEEISSGSTNTHSDYSLPDYEAFYLDDNHIEEKSSGSTTTHADFSQYDSFIFDLSIDSFPPADTSDFYHKEFAGELLTSYLHRKPRVHVPNVLPTHPTLDLDMDFILFSDSLFAYIVWIFIPFLTYPVAPPYLLSCGNEDTILTSASPFIILLYRVTDIRQKDEKQSQRRQNRARERKEREAKVKVKPKAKKSKSVKVNSEKWH